MSEELNDDNPAESMTLFPLGTYFYAPDGINRVTIQFPDQDSAIVFFEWCRSLVNGEQVDNINTEE